LKVDYKTLARMIVDEQVVHRISDTDPKETLIGLPLEDAKPQQSKDAVAPRLAKEQQDDSRIVEISWSQPKPS
jgi:hypothetical protein